MNEDKLFSSVYKASTRLVETLERAKIADLDNYLNKSPEVKKILFTPAKELMETDYKYLISSLSLENGDKTLYDLIKVSIDGANNVIKPYFSVDSTTGDIKAFVALITSGTEVIGIKMFSFDTSKPNITLARDVISWIPSLLEKYEVIKWDALADNPINKKYKKITLDYGGEIKSYKDVDSQKDCFQYIINRNTKKPL